MKIDDKMPYGEYILDPIYDGNNVIFNNVEKSFHLLLYLIFFSAIPVLTIFFCILYLLGQHDNVLFWVVLILVSILTTLNTIRTFLKHYNKKISLIINPEDKRIILKEHFLLNETESEYDYNNALWHIIDYNFHLDIPPKDGCKLYLFLSKDKRIFFACSRNIKNIQILAEEYSNKSGIKLRKF